jgi:hypothetical protein
MLQVLCDLRLNRHRASRAFDSEVLRMLGGTQESVGGRNKPIRRNEFVCPQSIVGLAQNPLCVGD